MTMIIDKLTVNGEEGCYAIVANTEIRYQFLGNALETQVANANNLAMLMNQGQQAVLDAINDVLDLNGVDENVVVEQLFEDNADLMLFGEAVFDAITVGAEALWEVIVQAGAALLAAMA